MNNIMYKFKLYIVKGTPKSNEALIKLEEIFNKSLNHEYDLEVIDVLKNPHLAITDRILATPTLILKEPLPEKRIMGNITNETSVLKGLKLIE